jgi:hypothetical protein
MVFRAMVVGGLMALLAGCGGASTLKVVPVSGKITYKGKAVEGAVVTFATEASPRTAVGTTDSQGGFKLSTVNTNDGAVAGEHVITVFKAAPPGSAQQQMKSPEDYMKHMQSQGGKNAKPPGADLLDKSIPGKYANPGTSGLKRTVVAGETNDFTIDLTD